MQTESVEEQSMSDDPGPPLGDQGSPRIGPVQEPDSPVSSGWNDKPTDGDTGQGNASQDVLDLEEVASQDPGYDGDVEVVKPYAIEEPDEPITPDTAGPQTPKLQSFAAHTQDDLVDSLRNLDCNSDSADNRLRKTTKRGRKRKPGSSETYTYYPYKTESPSPFAESRDNKADGSMLSPKRLRRRSRRFKEDISITPIASSSTISSESRPSTPSTFSATANGTEAKGEVQSDDKMDVD
ncbi:conserved hypothetical protein [Paecilomyces variotii No. 5]|uniref:Uncharacterized protein n=1 Tax=Byssochlamys spectabilis (strain No. 5 / NBRC 109023) TaxID=1356009 RepID=V5GBL5_BYSSN|nr:conserved hypothetical protein [Paecilomyces variotii No. 5]